MPSPLLGGNMKDQKMNRLEVNIDGNSYVLSSQKDLGELERTAEYVDSKISELRDANKRFNSTMTATLAALNIADELFSQIEEYASLKEEAKTPIREYPNMKKKVEEYGITVQKQMDQMKDLVGQCAQKDREIKELKLKNAELERKNSTCEHSLKEKVEDLENIQNQLEKAKEDALKVEKHFQEYRRTHP